MKKTIDFETNFNVITEDDIDLVLENGVLIYESESYADNHPFISPKMKTALYEYESDLYWVEIILADNGLCKKFFRISTNSHKCKDPGRSDDSIKLIIDNDYNFIEGYCTSPLYLDKLLSETVPGTARVVDVECLDGEVLEFSKRLYHTSFVYTYDRLTESHWVCSQPSKIKLLKVFKYSGMDVCIKNGKLRIRVDVITASRDMDSILDMRDSIFNAFISSYPTFNEGICNIHQVKLFNEQLKKMYDEADCDDDED